MSRLWETILNIFNYIGDNSGCHQIEDRCFKIKGYIFPICSRCTGVTIGQIVAIILFCFRYRINIVLSILLLLIMGVDWLIQHLNILMSNNTRRFITGLFGGFGLFNIYMYIILVILGYFNITLNIYVIF